MKEQEKHSLLDFPFEKKKLKTFKLSELFATIERATGKVFRIKDTTPNKQMSNSFPLISTSEINNGFVGFINSNEENITKKGNCITTGLFGTFFYQPIDFCVTYQTDKTSPLFRLEGAWINEKRGLFVATVLRNVHKGRQNRGRQVNSKNIQNLTVKLPINEKNEPD
jgi:hypothetical protein